MLKSASHSILGGLILKFFGNKKGILCSVDFKCCDLLLKLFSNSRSNSQNFWQAFKSNISTKFTRYSLHTKLPRAPHIYNFPSAPWILSVGLTTTQSISGKHNACIHNENSFSFEWLLYTADSSLRNFPIPFTELLIDILSMLI